MKPIGVFDSGVGGLTVAKALLRRLPRQAVLYLGDTARLPYGTKSTATVTRYTQRNLAFLQERGVKAVVVACNTASALALPFLDPPLPTWGVIEPGAARAFEVSRSGRIGVIATESTIRSDAYGEALRRLGATAIFSEACPLFVPLVEEGWLDGPVVEMVARRYLEPLLEAQVDTLVLGCTHYPLLRDVLQQVMGAGVLLVDSAEVVAETVARGLEEADLLMPAEVPKIHICCTDVSDTFARTMRTILEDPHSEPELVDV